MSKLEKSKHRVCDECDALLSNHNLEKMFQREVGSKKANFDETKQRLKEIDRNIMHAELELKHAKAEWQQKVKETDAKMLLREKQVLKRQTEISNLKEETIVLQVQLEKADQKLLD